MAEPICEDEGLLQEWSPLTQLIQKIPLKVQKGLFSQNLNLTCLDVISDYIVLGTNSHLVYWYSRANGELQRLRLENSQSEVTCVKVVSTVDYMVAAGTNQGTIVVFQIPKLVPESIPDQLKPKKRQIERFTINGLHNSPITNIEWSQNGMKLFSGDKNGLVVLTEIDFAMHLSKSVELINEQFEIVQLSYSQQLLVISTLYRSVICDGSENWKINQVGTKERKTLGKFGAALCKFNHGLVLYACRPGHRLWLADKSGVVQQTLIFKSALQSTCPRIQLINPVDKKRQVDLNFGKILQYADSKLIVYNSDVFYVLHPGAVSVTSVLHNARKILDLAVNDNEIFILEGERSLLRISPLPDKYSPEMNEFTNCRKSAFNLDEFAAKLKDTAVGSIKKITKDFIAISEQTSPNSPPALADDALELPPIYYLPEGTVPNISYDKVQIESPYDNNNGCERGPGWTLNPDCHEEVITRPLRKKRNKLPKKTILPPQVVESESDTTSNASDDRLTWGVANDLSLSEESVPTQSNSSFSVLRDVSTALRHTPGMKRDPALQEIMTTSDCKSQTSLDTCESVSECLMTSSEKFREEQEKTFARLANQGLLERSYNSEKTDNMSISLNTADSSSVTSENIQSPSEYSDNPSSLASRTKTTESQTYDNDQRYTPADFNDQSTGVSDSPECSRSLTNSMSVGVHKSRSNKTNFIDETDSAQLESIKRLDPPSTDDEKENSSLDFGIKNLSEFYSLDEMDQRREEKPESNATGEVANGYVNESTLEEDRLTRSTGFTSEQYSSCDPHARSSSLFNFHSSSSDLVSGKGPATDYRSKINDSSDHWLQYKVPEPITSLSVSRKYVMCVDINDRVYYSHLSGPGLSWVLLDYQASSLRVSLDGSVMWLMYKKSLFSLANPSRKCPVSGNMTLVAFDALSFTIDDDNNDGWIVNSVGRILRYPHETSGGYSTPEDVPCSDLVTDIACFGGMILVLTVKKHLLCKLADESEFRPIKTAQPVTSSFILTSDNLLWVVDDRNLIYFSDDFLEENPGWWQIHVGDYVFQNSTATLQNIYSKLTSLTGNVMPRGNASLMASNDESFWIGEKFSTSVRVNKSSVTGYMWKEVSFHSSLPSIQCMMLSCEGVFEDKGHVWLLATNGTIFCTSPKGNKIQAIPVPCDDNVLCIASSTDTLWVLSESGSVYSRLGLSEVNMTGNSWRELKLPQIDNLRLIWVSCGCDVAWGCDAHGRTFMTIGSPHHMATNIFDAAWLEVEGRPKRVKFVKVFVGPQMYMVWAVDAKGNLYVREGIFSYYQIGTSWVYVGGIEAVDVSISGTSVWALATDGAIYRRCGISERNYIGDYWKKIPGAFKVMSSSFTDDLWAITQENELRRISYRINVLKKNKPEDKEKESKSLNESWEMVLK